MNTTKPAKDWMREPETMPWKWRLRALYCGNSGIREAAAHDFDEDLPLSIGREGAGEPAGQWLLLDDDRVSREHARLTAHKDAAGLRITVRDLGSRNGTWLNGTRLDKDEDYTLSDGDILQVADSFLAWRHEPLIVSDAPIEALVGVSPAICTLRYEVLHCASTLSTILILGQTGTGKEVVAQAIHHLSGRSGKLVPVNCSAVSPSIAESEFFGVQKGAVTDTLPRPGYFREAHKGTLFLDEIGDLPTKLQPKLLRTLESGEVMPIGGSQPLRCDVRLIAATNRDLSEAMRDGSFRPELYARLNGLKLTLPPLRERREDILLLARHFAGPKFKPTPRLVSGLLFAAWPFNIRELKKLLIEELPLRGEEGVLTSLKASSGHFAALHSSGNVAPLPTAPSDGADAKILPTKPPAAKRWKPGSDPPTREQLVQLLTEDGGIVRRVADKLGCSSRQVRRWAEERYHLKIDDFRTAKKGSPGTDPVDDSDDDE